MSGSPLPPLYDRWFSELTGTSPAGEPGATCLDCVMLPSAEQMLAFHPSTKCCTYTPAIPNYLVGAALDDPRLDDVDGRESLRARIHARAGVKPVGLDRGVLTNLIAAEASNAFGRTPELRCPHYHSASGKCGIWLHRNAVCSTWFCKHQRGAVGRSFWHAVRDLFVEIELDLSRWCILELGAPYRVVPRGAYPVANTKSRLSAEDVAGTVSDEEYTALWGDWAGREETFYARAAELVSDLSWDDVLRICGPEVALCRRAMESARARRESSVVPTALLTRNLHVLHHGDPTILASYSATDPLAVPPILLDVLLHFRGQPVEEALEEISREAEVELDDDLLVRLADFEIVAEVAEE